MEFVTQGSTKAKVAHAMGLDAPHVLDVLDRAQFASDEEFLDAATKKTLERQNPEYAEIRRRLKRELEERRDAEARAEVERKYTEARNNVKLSQLDIKNIDAEAADMARRDLVAGRIGASLLGETIERYAAQLAEKRKNEKASSRCMTDIIRGMR